MNAKIRETVILPLKTYALVAIREVQDQSPRSFMNFLKDCGNHILSLGYLHKDNTYSLFSTLEKSPHPTHVIFSQSFLGFSFNITSLRKLPLIVQAILPLSYVCFHRSFIEIIMYLLKYITHLMLVSVCQQNLGRKSSCSCLCAKFLLQCFTLSSFLRKYLLNEIINKRFQGKLKLFWKIFTY